MNEQNDKDQPKEKTTTIDVAIDSCERKISEYKKQSSFFLLLIMTLILAVIMLTYALITSNKSVDLGEKFFTKASKHNLTAHKLAVHYSEITLKTLKEQYQLQELIDHVNKEKNIDTLWKYLKIHGEYASNHSKQTNKLSLIADSLLYNTDKLQRDIKDSFTTKPTDNISNSIYLALYGLFVLVFSVTISLYRYCLKQISKIEHFYFGLLRIRIAGSNSKTGYDDYVKESLTKEAFSFEGQTGIVSRSKQIESPIQGHPISDITTSIINKLLEGYELKPKK
jgi:hypothetical protein